jgi:hypothetical protein
MLTFASSIIPAQLLLGFIKTYARTVNARCKHHGSGAATPSDQNGSSLPNPLSQASL